MRCLSIKSYSRGSWTQVTKHLRGDLVLTEPVSVVASLLRHSPHKLARNSFKSSTTVPCTVLSLANEKTRSYETRFFSWCPGEDLNLHTFRHIHLKDTCIPISPPGHTSFEVAPLCTIGTNISTILCRPMILGCRPDLKYFQPYHHATPRSFHSLNHKDF